MNPSLKNLLKQSQASNLFCQDVIIFYRKMPKWRFYAFLVFRNEFIFLFFLWVTALLILTSYIKKHFYWDHPNWFWPLGGSSAYHIEKSVTRWQFKLEFPNLTETTKHFWSFFSQIFVKIPIVVFKLWKKLRNVCFSLFCS